MHPILFEIPLIGFPLKTFGVMLALGFLLGSHLFGKLIERHSKDPEAEVERYGAIPVWGLAGLVLGARALYVIVEVSRGSPTGHEYLANPLKMLAVWEGGLVMFGGLFGALAAGIWCARRHRLKVLHALDVGVAAGFFGQAVGRLGCLAVGDDYGARVPERLLSSWMAWMPISTGNGGALGPLMLRVPDPLPAGSLFDEHNIGHVLWATQPMMSIKALIVATVALWVLKRRRYEGQVALTAIFVYCTLRFGIEFLRGDDVRGVWFKDSLAVSTSQEVAVIAGALALALLLKHRKRRDALGAA